MTDDDDDDDNVDDNEPLRRRTGLSRRLGASSGPVARIPTIGPYPITLPRPRPCRSILPSRSRPIGAVRRSTCRPTPIVISCIRPSFTSPRPCVSRARPISVANDGSSPLDSRPCVSARSFARPTVSKPARLTSTRPANYGPPLTGSDGFGPTIFDPTFESIQNFYFILKPSFFFFFFFFSPFRTSSFPSFEKPFPLFPPPHPFFLFFFFFFFSPPTIFPFPPPTSTIMTRTFDEFTDGATGVLLDIWF